CFKVSIKTLPNPGGVFFYLQVSSFGRFPPSVGPRFPLISYCLLRACTKAKQYGYPLQSLTRHYTIKSDTLQKKGRLIFETAFVNIDQFS
ncbi:MAG: hypothetical protein ACK46S_07445, partial [Bacteroidota bacterium]